MKNRILFILMALLPFMFVSCSNVLEDTKIYEETFAEDVSAYSISIDDALAEYEASMGGVYTKSSNKKIANIQTVKYPVLTRSIDMAEENMFYIVNYEDNGGFAVLAADMRIGESVLAVVDNGNATPEMFTVRELKDSNGEVISEFNPFYNMYVNSLPSRSGTYPHFDTFDTVLIDLPDLPDSPIDPDMGFGEPLTRILVDMWYDADVKPMLEYPLDSLDQENCFTPVKIGKRCPVGCVGVAVSTIMMHNKKPEYVYEDHLGKIYMDYIMNYEDYELSRTLSILIDGVQKTVADQCNTSYARGGSWSLPSYAKACMKKNGYGNAKLILKYDAGKIEDMLDNGKPVFIAAGDLSNFEGHAWVIDGYYDYTSKYELRGIDTGRLYATFTMNFVRVHCAWGWGNTYNGYYSHKAFNLEDGSSLNSLFEMITY